MIEKKQIQDLLSRKWGIFPICIPSYKRWDRKENKTITNIIEHCDQGIQENTYVFVRAEQEQAYRENFPTINIVTLPKVNGLAGTRQYIQDYVISTLRKPYFIDMDDDIIQVKYVFHDPSGDHLSKSDETDFSQILRFGCAIARMAFEKSKCVLGNFHRVRFASNYPASQTAYVVNKGSTPRQITFVNARELFLRKIKRNLDFDETGDDVGFVAEICKKGGDMFQIPCLAYAFVDDAINSVIRNNENRRRLAAQEYALLKKYPMRDYLKITQTFEDGSYKFCDIDYRKYREICDRPKEEVMIEDFLSWVKEKAKQHKEDRK